MANIYLILEGQQAGPYPLGQIQEFLREGRISSSTPAWYEGLGEWSTVATVEAHFSDIAAGPPPFSPPLSVPARKKMSGCMWALILVGGCVLLLAPCLCGLALGPITNGLAKAKENMAMQKARSIALVLFQYSIDHAGAYPSGNSSTEVFQKLIDEKYVSDPALFYISMAGKTRAASSQLAPENVCFDVTSGVTSDSPEGVPMVFNTGYSITYTAGMSALRNPGVELPFPGLAVAYKGRSARWLQAAPDGSIADFIPDHFDVGSHTYRQLRP